MKAKILIILTIVLCMLNVNTTYATENNADENNGGNDKTFIYIEATYSDNITPLDGDIFEITYCVHGESGMENTATITVDASKICNDKETIDMPSGTYDIKRITYVGTNKGRNSYGVEGYFNVSHGGTDPIVITVGYKATKKADDKWGEYIGVGLITDAYFMSVVNENPNITMEELEAEIIETETKENESNFENISDIGQSQNQSNEDVYDEEDFYSEDYGVEIQNGTDKEPEIEVHTTTEEQHTENATNNPLNIALLLCLIILIILGIILFNLKSKYKR